MFSCIWRLKINEYDDDDFMCILQTFYHLQQLRKLTLSDNQISHLSSDVSNFAELQEFDISHNGMSSNDRVGPP